LTLDVKWQSRGKFNESLIRHFKDTNFRYNPVTTDVRNFRTEIETFKTKFTVFITRQHPEFF